MAVEASAAGLRGWPTMITGTATKEMTGACARSSPDFYVRLQL